MWNYTLFVKLHTLCMQYQSNFFRIPIGKFYTWMNFLHNQRLWWLWQISGGIGVIGSMTKPPAPAETYDRKYLNLKAAVHTYLSEDIWHPAGHERSVRFHRYQQHKKSESVTKGRICGGVRDSYASKNGSAVRLPPPSIGVQTVTNRHVVAKS